MILALLIMTINLNLNAQQNYSPLYFCTGADTQYFHCLKQLIGSIHATNFEHAAEIAVFNLGLTQEEINLLNRMRKVKVYAMEMTHPDLLTHFTTKYGQKRGLFAWKPVAIKQALDLFPYVLWLDAGCLVMKPLDNLFQHIQQNGYFVISGGHKIRTYTTRTIAEKFNLYQEGNNILDMDQLEAGLQGICKSNRNAYNNYLLPVYEMSKQLHTYFTDDGSAPGGWGMARQDQTLFSIVARLAGLETQRAYCDPAQIILPINGNSVPFYINTNWPPAPPANTDIFVQAYGRINTEQYIVYR